MMTSIPASIPNAIASFEEAHSPEGCHGFLCALNAGPGSIRALQDWLPPLLDADWNEIDDEVRQAFSSWRDDMQKAMNLGEKPHLPLPLNWRKPAAKELIMDWAVGFMDAVLMDEDDWYAVGEEEVANLLLPFVALSQIFDDPDLEAIYRNDKLLAEFAKQLPDLVTDVYLFYHAQG